MTVVMVAWWGAPAVSAWASAKDLSPRALLERAKTHERAKEYKAALADYRRFLSAHPGNDDVRAMMAKLLSWQGQFAEAASLYQDVLTRRPHDDESRVGLARVLSWQQKYDDARREYERVLLTEPQHLDAVRGLADVLSWSGHPDQAITFYEQVVAATGDAEVVARLRALKAELSETKLSAPPSRSDPSSPGERDTMSSNGTEALERGRRLETTRQYVEAASVYRLGLQRYPENDDLRSALARILSWQGPMLKRPCCIATCWFIIQRIRIFVWRSRRSFHGKSNLMKRMGSMIRCCRAIRSASRPGEDSLSWHTGRGIGRKP